MMIFALIAVLVYLCQLQIRIDAQSLAKAFPSEHCSAPCHSDAWGAIAAHGAMPNRAGGDSLPIKHPQW